jgi:DNA sulfur modification protein DndE
MRNKTRLILLFFPLMILASCSDDPVLYLAGDSTMADKPPESEPEKGWGQMLPGFFGESIRIENHARNGRSTRSFIYEGRWDSIVNTLEKGDYVIIQFGHNDQGISKTGRYATPEEYAYNLTKFVRDVRSRKATPILCTPVMRRRFDENGRFYDVHGEYPGIVRKLAEAYDVPLIDMHRSSEALIVELGPEGSKELFLHVPPGIYPKFPDGVTDNTHFNEYGATRMAELAVEGIKDLDINLKNHLK